MHYYNPLDKFCKSITGAVPENVDITFKVVSPSENCCFVVRKDGCDDCQYLKMIKNGDCFELTAKFSSGLFWYSFDLGCGKHIGCGEGLQGVCIDNPVPYQLSVYSYDFETPKWLKGGVIYQIFPDRFCRAEKNKQIAPNKVLRNDWGGVPVFEPNEKGEVVNNDFFGGDIKGIISKLDYLNELGVTVIYLNPIFEAFSNHRYDTGNYMAIDSLLGTEDDFKELIDKANDFGIKIILDGVFNHTGDDSIYFNKYGNYPSVGAYQSKKSQFYNWFTFTKFPNEYSSWWGIKTLPAVNKHNPEYINYITGDDGVLAKYIKMGIAGWRLDVVDELHSGFVREIRKAVKKVNKDAVIIGEVWEDASNKIAYGVRREYFLGNELDSVMNYPLKNAILNYAMHGDCSILVQTIKELIDHYPKQVLDCLMNILSTHDTYRLISALSGVKTIGKSKADLSKILLAVDDYDNAVNRVKIASLLQYSLPGVPSLYYGDEAGMQGYVDPLNRRCYPWGNEDCELINWYKKLGELRKRFSLFIAGDFDILYARHGGFVFKRFDENSELLIAINLGDNQLKLSFDGTLYSALNGKTFEKNVLLLKNQFEVLYAK